MNRILFEPCEVSPTGIVTFGGARAKHVAEILHGAPGQFLKTGTLNGPIGTAVIECVTPLAQRAEDGSPTWQVTARVTHNRAAAAPWVDIILAPPRPRAMKRLLPQLAALGVGKIILVGAHKVEKAFWGAQLLRAEIYRPCLVEGLMQAGTTALPEICVARDFKRWLEHSLEETFGGTRVRLVAHPYGASHLNPLKEALTQSAAAPTRPLVAIGPEGGWQDSEVALLESHGFTRFSLGNRILRTDTATIAILAQLMPAFDTAHIPEEDS